MNRNENNSIIYMEKDELKKLVTEVKETVATNEKHVFSAADLWRIQRLSKKSTGLSKKWEHYS